MSHNPELVPKKHPFGIKFGQKPLTEFKDYRKAIKVTLKNPEPVESMMNRIYSFVKATWADSPEVLENATKEQKEDALDQMLSGKALQLGLETVSLSFMIGGITHIDAQQITRQRIGVTFSAQCTGDRFLNHNEVLVEESIAQDPVLLKSFIDATLAAKMSYAEMVDSEKVSIQAARSILPRNIETFYNMQTNLATLLFFHQKRIDDGSQTWQMNEISRQLAKQVSDVYPQLLEVFKRNENKFRFQREASADRKNTFSTALYIPKDDDFDYHTRDFVYPISKEQMNYTNTPIKNLYYWGLDEVTKEQFDAIKNKYSENDKSVHDSSPTNSEIYEMNRSVNADSFLK